MITPLIFLLIVLTVDFAGWLYAWTEVGNAARAAANYAALGPTSAGAPATPKGTAITALMAVDLAKLPDYSTSNPAVIVCWNNNGTLSTILGTCTSGVAATDPEASSYIAVSVDLTYTYTPFFSAFTFSSLGIRLPSIPTSIHRRIVMRFI
jgi:Flp pilus assembly protein TadG